MRIYNRDEACGFRFTDAPWGQFSNFAPLAAPIAAGPWAFPTSEHLYQAAKFGAAPAVQCRIAGAPTAREAAAIGRGTTAGLDPDWMAQRVNVMRWVLRMKREANAAAIDAALAATGERAIVEVSTRDAWWGAKPAGDALRGHNVLGRLWMELRQQLSDGDPAAHSAAWSGRIRVGGLANAR
ncbi:MAG: NADAR family protein [Rhodospirillaceae bacterium]|nr:NADAR family protein [Rhodospirillaceae bacterium]